MDGVRFHHRRIFSGFEASAFAREDFRYAHASDRSGAARFLNWKQNLGDSEMLQVLGGSSQVVILNSALNTRFLGNKRSSRLTILNYPVASGAPGSRKVRPFVHCDGAIHRQAHSSFAPGLRLPANNRVWSQNDP